MKIAILAPSPVPYTIGGAEKLWWGMLDYLNQQTSHQAELIKIPSPERNFREVIQSYEAFSRMDLSHFDCVISTKYPAWMIDHPNHICYLQHTLRGLYDTYHFCGQPESLPALPDAFVPLLALLKATPAREQLQPLFAQVQTLMADPAHDSHFAFPGPLTRAIVHHLDRIAQRPGAIQRYAAISHTVRRRRDYFPADAEVLVMHHPSDLKGIRSGDYRYLFTASRLDQPKRIELLVRAFLQLPDQIDFLIAGTGPQEALLHELAKDDPRIKFLGRITDSQIIDYYADALFVPFIPYDEDYGLITIEAMQAGKAVLTTTDAGGVNEFVVNGETGLSVAPDESALRDAMAQLIRQPEDTARMGREAQSRISRHISWQATMTPLLGEALTPMPAQTPNRQTGLPSPRKRIVVTSTFPAWPPHGGGQSRLYHLYREVAREHDVTILSFGQQGHELQLTAGLSEICIPYNEAQRRVNGELSGKVQTDISDILVIDSVFLNPAYMNTLKALADNSDLIISSHPFFYKAIRAVWQGAVGYDAQDVEADVKESILGGRPGGEVWLDKVRWIERHCLHDSRWAVSCSARDADRLLQLYGERETPCAVVPNGVDTQLTPFTDLQTRRHQRQRMGINQEVILFMGSWHGPNIEAALITIELACKYPQWQFWLLGSLCDHPDIPPPPPNVLLLGALPEADKQQVMATASIALNPMLSGSGTNLKMLDYAACGLEIISTPFGNRGIEFVHEHEISVAPIERFGPAIEALLALPDDQRNERLRNARLRTEADYDWSVCARPLLELVKY
ncbi:glycosyltransferase family 4 protein [Nitrincola alkalilacustris]|uniref:glycosyltransferase family 4 protein n=1 Tax=Nitrincola alkalilacustris TaxID=1571224 RepID=UPI00124F451F|nr:glycosyltransferase family 4 protein [Nitrincola alkalilacustris]